MTDWTMRKFPAGSDSLRAYLHTAVPRNLYLQASQVIETNWGAARARTAARQFGLAARRTDIWVRDNIALPVIIARVLSEELESCILWGEFRGRGARG